MKCEYDNVWLTGTPWQENCGEVEWSNTREVDIIPILGANTPFLRGRGNAVERIPVPIVLQFPNELAALNYCATNVWTLGHQGVLKFEEENAATRLTITFSNAVLEDAVRHRSGTSVRVEYTFVVNGPPSITEVANNNGGGVTPSGPNPLSPSDTNPATLLELTGYDMSPITEPVTLTSATRSTSQGNDYYSQYFVFQLDGLAQKGRYVFETSSAFDSIIFLHSTANSLAFTQANLVAEDDEGGPGSGSRIAFDYDGTAPFIGSLEVSTYSPNESATGVLTVTCEEYIGNAIVGNELIWNMTGLTYQPGAFSLWASAYNNFPDANSTNKYLQAVTFQGELTSGTANITDLAILLTPFGNDPAPTAQNLLSTANNSSWNGSRIIGNGDNINAPSWVPRTPWPFTAANFVPNQLYTIDLTSSNLNAYTFGFYRGNAGSLAGGWTGTIKVINTP
ncbi:MAG: hypothetical protein VKK63_00210 [Synechococcus sp.]|nr:hypothetical protein [Synechococcus sp.]